jgi:hypothetical protein
LSFTHLQDTAAVFLCVYVMGVCTLDQDKLLLYRDYIIWQKVKLSLCLSKHYTMKTYGRVEVYIHSFLTLAQN